MNMQKQFSINRLKMSCGVVFAVLIVLGLIVYGNALKNPFLVDDKTLILGDPLRHKPSQIFRHFLPSYEHGLSVVKDETLGAKYFRPWAHVLPLLNYCIFHDHLVGYHIFNLVLLAFAALMVFHFLLRLFDDRRLAFLTAIIFVIHPINGVLVNYITASVFSLMVIFAMASLMCVLKSYRSLSVWWIILGLLAYVNAIFCHETALALPLLMLVVLGVSDGNLWRKLFIVLPYAVVGAAYFYFRIAYASLKSSLYDNAMILKISGVEYGTAFAKLVAWYINALVTFRDIVLIKAVAIVPSDVWLWGTVILIALGATVVVYIKVKRPVIRFGILFFLLGFLPAMAGCLFQPTAGLIFEPHWVLISSVGFFVILADLLERLFVPFHRSRILAWRWGDLIFTVIIAACLIAGWRNNRLWSSQEKYCQYWSKVSPTLDLPWFFWGDALVERNKLAEAKEVYTRAVDESRRPFEYYYNVAGILLLEGKDLSKAKEMLLKALDLYPFSSAARVSLGIVYSVLDGREDIAERLFKEALYYNPTSVEARMRLAELYIAQQRNPEAIAQYQAILKENPEHITAAMNLWRLQLAAGDGRVVEKSAEVLLRNLDNPYDLLDLAQILAEGNSVMIASRYFEKALQKGPDVPGAYLESGKFLGNLGDLDAAIRIWSEGQKRFSNESEFDRLITQARKLMR